MKDHLQNLLESRNHVTEEIFILIMVI